MLGIASFILTKKRCSKKALLNCQLRVLCAPLHFSGDSCELTIINYSGVKGAFCTQ